MIPCIMCSIKTSNHLYCKKCVKKPVAKKLMALEKHDKSGNKNNSRGKRKFRKFHSKALSKFNESDDSKYEYQRKGYNEWGVKI